MKKILQKAFEFSVISAIWLTIGTLLGFSWTMFLLRPTIDSEKKAWDDGYKKASEECARIFKNLK